MSISINIPKNIRNSQRLGRYKRLKICPIGLALRREDVCPQSHGDSTSPQISRDLLRLPISLAEDSDCYKAELGRLYS